VINNVYHTAYHKTTVHPSKTPCVTRCRLTSHYILPAEYNSLGVEDSVVVKLLLEQAEGAGVIEAVEAALAAINAELDS
jgi:hypothetical protein